VFKPDKMSRQAKTVERLLDQQEGILKLKPTYARRVYADGGRLLGGQPGSTYIPRDRLWVPERWIASGTVAVNPHPIPGEGLSHLAGANMTLNDALELAGERMLGRRRYHTHGPEFRVLIKLLDGLTPIPFHFHASDEAVTRDRKHFVGSGFGKEEAYYHLDRPKGRCPYTHAGLYPGTTLRDLRRAIARGGGAVLELSPSFLQRVEEGFFVPAGVVHRPGTAMALEIQQPSDVSTRLEDRSGDKQLTPEEMHPGFPTLTMALRNLDFKASMQESLLDRCRLVPRPVSRRRLRSASEDWIFPPNVCRKFSGKRLRVRTRITTIEKECYAMFIWKGAGKVGPRRVKAGDEFFVTQPRARAGVVIERTTGDVLELFKCFAAPVS